jgi:DNA-binding NarL/FixJ family response regulator
MSTCNSHAVERVADVRPDFALPLGRYDHVYPERVQRAFNPDEAVYIVARSATSDTRTSGVSRGLSPELPPKMAERLRERERHEKNRARPRKVITETIRAEIIDRSAKGQKNSYIASKVGVSETSVRKVVNMAHMSAH